MQWLAALFDMLLQGLQAALIPGAGVAVIGGLLLAIFHVIHWGTLLITLLFIALAFSAPSLIAALPHG